MGGTWFHTGSGIYRVSTRQLEQAFRDSAVRLDDQLFDTRDGLRSVGTMEQFGGTAVRGPDGRLWFLNAGNVAWIDPHHLYRNPVPPPVSIKSLTVEGRALAPAEDRKLGAGISNLQINYTALSLQNPERVKFRYQLEGVDRTWIDAGNRREAYYTRLGPGHYRFHVIAANNDGVWNTTGASLQFEIPPTFLQSRWFTLLCALSAALALWMAYSWRLRRITAAIQNLHEERMAERERIARELHDTLLQGFQGLMLRLQAVADRVKGEPGQAHRLIEQTLERADAVLEEGRDRVKDLRTTRRTPLDLSEILLRVAQDAQPHPTKVQVTVEGAMRALQPIVREETEKIGIEAITNALLHAQASTIDVGILFERRRFALRISDDGIGIDHATLNFGRERHFGLAGMRERARGIRAHFSLTSRRGDGTDIELIISAGIAYAAKRPELLRWLRRRFSTPGKPS
jgi:signal transduction histidine kinase